MTDHPAGQPLEKLQRDCDVRFQRRSGPGGQHRNKVETGVFLEHRPTGVSAQASERRQQADNLKVAYWRLRINLALKVRCSRDAPSEAWQSRCTGGRIHVSSRHGLFPTLLAEALDHLSQSQWQLAPAAAALNCSSSQLVRLLQQQPAALTYVNRHRHNHDLPRLR